METTETTKERRSLHKRSSHSEDIGFKPTKKMKYEQQEIGKINIFDFLCEEMFAIIFSFIVDPMDWLNVFLSCKTFYYFGKNYLPFDRNDSECLFLIFKSNNLKLIHELIDAKKVNPVTFFEFIYMLNIWGTGSIFTGDFMKRCSTLSIEHTKEQEFINKFQRDHNGSDIEVNIDNNDFIVIQYGFHQNWKYLKLIFQNDILQLKLWTFNPSNDSEVIEICPKFIDSYSIVTRELKRDIKETFKILKWQSPNLSKRTKQALESQKLPKNFYVSKKQYSILYKQKSTNQWKIKVDETYNVLVKTYKELYWVIGNIYLSLLGQVDYSNVNYTKLIFPKKLTITPQYGKIVLHYRHCPV